MRHSLGFAASRLRAAFVEAHAARRLPDTASPAPRRARHHLLRRLRGAA